MRILVVASECVPFSKTGGLGDVIGALPRALAQAGHEVRVVVPYYGNAPKMAGIDLLGVEIEVELSGELHRSTLRRGSLPGSGLPDSGVPVDFVVEDSFYDRPEIYGAPKAYPDNDRRFIYFCRAALEAARATGFVPEIVHCHDWQTASIPLLLKVGYPGDGAFRDAATVFTLHNLAYQGNFSPEVLSLIGLDSSWLTVDGLEFFGQASLLKGAFLHSDVLNTVSPTYAEEILTPEFGFGLDGVLATRRDDLYGVLNGIDEEIWNPETDDALPERFGAKDLGGKEACRQELIREAGLSDSPEPLLGFVGRLAHQKGLDLIEGAVPELARRGYRLIVLGTGEKRYHESLSSLRDQYPEHLGLFLTFDEALSRRIFAGSDFCLMPSLYEPCGLNQLICLRYGTLPIVRSVGGLRDTIVDLTKDSLRAGIANGFVIERHTTNDLIEACERARALRSDPDVFARLRSRVMLEDHSWVRSGREYVELYERALQKRAARG